MDPGAEPKSGTITIEWVVGSDPSDFDTSLCVNLQ